MTGRFFFYFLFLIPVYTSAAETSCKKKNENKIPVTIVKTAIIGEKLTDEWKTALKSRVSRESIDSFGSIKRPLSGDEMAWKELIESKAAAWNTFRDSLAVPFNGLVLNDTIIVLLGYLGVDDGFTYGGQTVCLDITALFRAYGNAGLPENDNRIDRIFAHEYTHLLHKEWALKYLYKPVKFKDSILWECWYEGMGMYRSLSSKWLPVNDSLPAITRATLDDLSYVFAGKMISIQRALYLSDPAKERLHANLSRGPVNKKWGAFPVAIWLLLEANGDDRNLISWINKGPSSVIELAGKYLPAKINAEFSAAFKQP